jgi:hypothetical protein
MEDVMCDVYGFVQAMIVFSVLNLSHHVVQ